MNPSAVVMLVLVGGLVLGGFILALIVAMKREKSKSLINRG